MGDWQQRKDRPARDSLSYQTDDRTDPSCLFSRKKNTAATLNCMERQKGGGKKIVGPSCINLYSVGMKYQTRARNAPIRRAPQTKLYTQEKPTNSGFPFFAFFFCVFSAVRFCLFCFCLVLSPPTTLSKCVIVLNIESTGITPIR